MSAVGVYGPEVVLNGSAVAPYVLAAASITVKNLDGSAAVCYTDATGATTRSNVHATDARGQLVFYAAPGSYLLSYTDVVGVQSLRVEVEMSASVAVAAADGPAILSATHTTGGNISLLFASNWGVNAQGNAYHDTAGAASGEEAAAAFDSNGNLAVTKINH